MRKLLCLSVLMLLPSLAHAHVVGEASGFLHGLAHPLGGLDHVLAMLAIGLWAAQMGGRSLWVLPLGFVGAMALGGALPMLGINLPFVGQGVVWSVLLPGVLIAAQIRLPLILGVSLAGLFALWHGYAHGAEMPPSASVIDYAAGFMVATAALNMAAIAFGLVMQRLARERLIHAAGAGIALFGMYLAA